MAQFDIPWESLSAEALSGIIEEFVTREGTEYGVREVRLEDKISQVRKQLQVGKTRITYDDVTHSCSIELVK